MRWDSCQHKHFECSVGESAADIDLSSPAWSKISHSNTKKRKVQEEMDDQFLRIKNFDFGNFPSWLTFLQFPEP